MNDVAVEKRTGQSATGSTDQRSGNARFLAIYLRDHHAASQAGTRLAQRVALHNPHIHQIGREVREDMLALRQTMGRLGVRRDRVKDALAIAAERLARLKPNGRVVERSSLSDLIELETLVVGITGKRACGQVWVRWERSPRQRLIASSSEPTTSCVASRPHGGVPLGGRSPDRAERFDEPRTGNNRGVRAVFVLFVVMIVAGLVAALVAALA